MFQIKATRGNVDLSVFDLAELTNKANQTAQEINEHNQNVYSKFYKLIQDYISQLNSIVVDELGLKLYPFQNFNKHIKSDYIDTYNSLSATYEMGHGRACITLYFNAPKVNGKYSYDFNGTIKIRKYWGDECQTIKYNLESVAQILELGADVIKILIINRDVESYNEQEKLEKQLKY